MAIESAKIEPLLSRISSEHRHSGWFCCIDNARLMVARMGVGECVVVGYRPTDGRFEEPLPTRELNIFLGPKLWCLTHDVEENYGHSQDMGRARAG